MQGRILKIKIVVAVLDLLTNHKSAQPIRPKPRKSNAGLAVVNLKWLPHFDSFIFFALKPFILGIKG